MADLSLAMRAYILAVAIGGTALALLLAAGGAPLAGRTLLAAALLAVMAGLAERFSVHLTHKVNVNVATAAYMAMILALPAGFTGALALAATLAGRGLRHRRDGVELAFNGGQTALYVMAGAATWYALAPADPAEIDLTLVLAAVATTLVLHLVNTALVSVAAALHLGGSPLRVWRRTLALDFPAHVCLSAVGVVAAYLALAQPLLLPVLALPVALVQVAIVRLAQVREDTAEALAALVDVVELRDPYTAGHSRRVAATAREIALRLGLTAEEADDIESAGRVHDVGKVGITPGLLEKPGKLTPEEFEEMARHPVLGAEVVARFNAFAAGNPIVRHHHERLDGQGYPDGLAGEAIPLGARILAVADTWDALTSDRPYRPAMSRERAIRILLDGAGTQWDAAVVSAFLATLEAAEEPLPATLTAMPEPVPAA